MAKSVGSLLDGLIGVVSPKAGFARAYNRARMLNMQGQVRRYEGAGDGRRASSWVSNSNPSAKDLVARDHKKLVQRSRELNINNSYAKKAPYLIANSLVGTGILATPFIPKVVEKGALKEVPKASELAKVFAAGWEEWSDATSADYDGVLNFYGLQHLAVRTVVVSGEVLAIRKRVKYDVNQFGFQVLIVEGDFIDTTKDTSKDPDGGYTYKGIKYDKDNRRSGYWIWDKHPSETGAKSSLVKIENIIHVFDIERSGQNRGVPFAASTITTQRDFADYMDAELLKQKGAACFSAVVQKQQDPEGNGEDGTELESLEPGSIQYLNPGETIHFPTLPQNPGLPDFVKTQLRSIAAGYLMPYENLSGDLSNVTFISGRLGQLDFKKQVEYWQHTMFIPQFCNRVFEWFVEGAKIVYSIDKALPVKAKWTAPRWVMMDPTKEITAMKETVRAGFSSWQDVVRENGNDPAKVLEELTEDQRLFQEAGLMPTWSPYFELMAKLSMQAGKDAAGAAAETAKK